MNKQETIMLAQKILDDYEMEAEDDWIELSDEWSLNVYWEGDSEEKPCASIYQTVNTDEERGRVQTSLQGTSVDLGLTEEEQGELKSLWFVWEISQCYNHHNIGRCLALEKKAAKVLVQWLRVQFKEETKRAGYND